MLAKDSIPYIKDAPAAFGYKNTTFFGWQDSCQRAMGAFHNKLPPHINFMNCAVFNPNWPTARPPSNIQSHQHNTRINKTQENYSDIPERAPMP
jgi:hypothetical protein